MKTHRFLGFILSGILCGASTMEAAVVEPVVTQLGPHHRVIRTDTGSYVELETAMNYLRDDGTWSESKELIEVVNGIGVARQGQTKVTFAPNLNSDNAIILDSPDQKRFRSRPLGLVYYDCTTGQTLLIAEIKDSIGEVQPNGYQIIYPDAFTDLKADIKFSYRKASFESEVILRQMPPPPDTFSRGCRRPRQHDGAFRWECWRMLLRLRREWKCCCPRQRFGRDDGRPIRVRTFRRIDPYDRAAGVHQPLPLLGEIPG